MSKPPAFMFYPHDFLADSNVEMQTLEQTGAYIRLLCHAWAMSEPGVLPDDDVLLARLCRMTPQQWKKNRSAIIRCFDVKDGKLYQKRMISERAKQCERSHSARASASIRWGNRNANALPTHCNGNALQSHSDGNALQSSVYSLQSSTSGQGIRSREGRAAFVVPSLEEMQEYGQQIGWSLNEVARCRDYYVSNGWKVGRNPMKDWKATMRNWQRSNGNAQNQSGGRGGIGTRVALPSDIPLGRRSTKFADGIPIADREKAVGP